MSTERDYLILDTDDNFSVVRCNVCSNAIARDEEKLSCSFCSNAFHHACLNFSREKLAKAHEYFQCNECNETEDLYIDQCTTETHGFWSEATKWLKHQLHRDKTPEKRLNQELDLQNALIKERQCTDRNVVYIKLIFILVLFILIISCMLSGGVNKFTHGVDSCGNVCGQVNQQRKTAVNCTEMDLVRKRYLMIEDSINEVSDIFSLEFDKRKCVTSCNKTLQISHYCLRFGDKEVETKNRTNFKNESVVHKNKGEAVSYDETFGEVIEIIIDVYHQGYLSFHRLALAYLTPSVFYLPAFLLIRYLPSLFVWGTVIISNLIIAGAATYYWLEYLKSESSNNNIGNNDTLLWLPLVITTISVTLMIVMFLARRRYKIIEKVFKETARAAGAMPSIFIIPIFTCISLAAIGYTWFHTIFWIECSGQNLTDNDSNYYNMGFLQKVTRWCNIVAIFWTVQFLFKCQDMIIAGAVVRWYFARDKSQLKWPLLKSFSVMYRYHSGSVLLGCLYLYIVNVIKYFLIFFVNICSVTKKDLMKFGYLSIQIIIRYVSLDPIDIFANLTEKYGCIEMAIYGKNYLESAARGFEVQLDNLYDSFIINSLAKFLLSMSKIVFFTISFCSAFVIFVMSLSEQTDTRYKAVVYLTAVFVYVQTSFFFSIFQVILETLYICFCEDMDANNGDNKPYYMRKALMAAFHQNRVQDKYQNGHEMMSPGFPYQPTTEELPTSHLI